jgi:4-hydroxy-tetrahydrodipicolinate reductase
MHKGLTGPTQVDSGLQVMNALCKQHPDMIIIDYTVPGAVNDNARFYIEHQAPFVMGTTGGNREMLLDETRRSGVYAVIAPQMGKQVVAFQAMLQNIADEFPGAFDGYRLEVVESHQRTKADTSGTAKAIVQSFQKLGVLDFGVDDIEKVRDPIQSMYRMGVPREALDGHAFHTYRLSSPDKSVAFEFQHNVCGRTIYAEGTVDAFFLYGQVKNGSEKKLFDMVDVLRGGQMR